MANAYFCNCVAETISLNLNNSLSPTSVESRALGTGGITNVLSMASFPMSSSAAMEKGKFGITISNSIVINFETLRSESHTFDVAIDKSLADQDVYFYVFQETLTGQDAKGYAVGISIQAHETVKKVIQSGVEVLGIKLDTPDSLQP